MNYRPVKTNEMPIAMIHNACNDNLIVDNWRNKLIIGFII